MDLLLMTFNILFVVTAAIVLWRRKARFTPEWQKAVWFWLLVLALYAVQQVWGFFQHQVGTGVLFLNFVLSFLFFLAAYLGSETVMLAVRGDDTYLDSALGLLARLKAIAGSLVSGVKDKLQDQKTER